MDILLTHAYFLDEDEHEREIMRPYPPLGLLYVNLITRASALEHVRLLKIQGATVILGGPEPANYPREYLSRGADVVVAGEGERTSRSWCPISAWDVPYASRGRAVGAESNRGGFSEDSLTLDRTRAVSESSR